VLEAAVVQDERFAAARTESRALLELAALQRDPLFYGFGAPRGDGRPVLVVPGLFGSDAYLQPLRGWLMRVGYTPLRSSLTLNAGCPNRLREQVEVALLRQLSAHSGPITLIGHSRGGLLAWAIASRMQARVQQLALLGSPAAAVVAMMRAAPGEGTPPPAASFVADAGARALRLLDPDCTVPACGCAYTDDLRRPLHAATRVLAVCSRDDPIVFPAGCPVPDAENVEVSGSHSGLVYNRAVYRALARFLATPAD